jgi:transcription elongation factor Elf1
MKLNSVSELNERIEEVEEQITKFKNLKQDLIAERRKLEQEFGNGGDCPECGSSNPAFKGYGRTYAIECENCGFTVYGSD